MQKLPAISSDELIRILANYGYFVDHVKGSHFVLISQDKGRLVVPRRKVLPKGTLLAILRQAKISRETLQENL